jgi:hypothetical protein
MKIIPLSIFFQKTPEITSSDSLDDFSVDPARRTHRVAVRQAEERTAVVGAAAADFFHHELPRRKVPR